MCAWQAQQLAHTRDAAAAGPKHIQVTAQARTQGQLLTQGLEQRDVALVRQQAGLQLQRSQLRQPLHREALGSQPAQRSGQLRLLCQVLRGSGVTQPGRAKHLGRVSQLACNRAGAEHAGCRCSRAALCLHPAEAACQVAEQGEHAAH